jgi:hypothetical protein
MKTVSGMILKTIFLSFLLVIVIPGAARAAEQKTLVITNELLMSDVDLVRAKVMRFSQNMNACMGGAENIEFNQMKKCLCGFRPDFYRAYSGLGDLIKQNPHLKGVMAEYTPPGETHAYRVDLGAYAVMLLRYEPHMCRS